MKSSDFSPYDNGEKIALRDPRRSKKHPFGVYTYYRRKLSFSQKVILFLLFLMLSSLGFYLVKTKSFSGDSAVLLFIAGQLLIMLLYFAVLRRSKQLVFDEREIVIGDFKASRIFTAFFFLFPVAVFTGLLFQQVPFIALFIAGAAVAIGFYIHFIAGKKYFSTDKQGNILIKKHSGDLKFNIRELRELRLYNLPERFKNITVPKKAVFVLSDGHKESIPLGSIRSVTLRIFIPPIFLEAYFYRQAVSAGFRIQPMSRNLTGRNGWFARSVS